MKKKWKEIQRNGKKYLITILSAVLVLAPLSSPVFALNEDVSLTDTSEAGFQIELSEKDIEELHSYFPENVNFSDDQVDKRLVESGEFKQEELNVINSKFDNNIRKSRAKNINGYNKYRTFKRNGKNYLYVYVSGRTLQKIKQGAKLSTIFGGFLPNRFLGIAVVAIGSIIGKNMSGINTRYGIVLKYVADRWNFQGATYTYRYTGWFYQT